MFLTCLNRHIRKALFAFQEKKGGEQPKPDEKEALRIEYEYQKLEKLLGMVRHGDEKAKRKPVAPKPTTKATEAKKNE